MDLSFYTTLFINLIKLGMAVIIAWVSCQGTRGLLIGHVGGHATISQHLESLVDNEAESWINEHCHFCCARRDRKMVYNVLFQMCSGMS